MNVLYTCDNNYAWLMGISLISLFKKNKDIKDIDVFFIAENLDVENRAKIEQIASEYERTVKIIDVDVTTFNLSNNFISLSRWPLSAFSRLYSANLLPTDIDKVLYIDCDTIINENISQLYDTDMKDKVFCGVKECISTKYKTNIGLTKKSNYINAGVMLINLKLLRKENIAKLIDDFVKKYNQLICYADQDVLNGIFSNRIGILNPGYNVMTIDKVRTYKEIMRLRKPYEFYSKEEILNAIENPKIIHYTTNLDVIRPWYSNSNHPYLKQFMDSFNDSPWKNTKLEKYEFKAKQAKITSSIKKIKPQIIGDMILGFIYIYLRPNIIKLKYIMKFKGE